MKKIILSGMRPTGPLHVGHLFGALKNWVAFQDEYSCFFMVADWHAHMSEYAEPGALAKNSLEIVADWMACGIDPEKSTIFVQSHITEHTQLFALLANITPLGWLERCPTYKEQLREVTTRDLQTYGFLGYPVLQAGDILLYKAHVVPVGEDQLAHLELTREIARRFHNLYGELFPEPEALLSKTPRIQGLDGKKMSKSLDNYIGLGEDPDSVRKKVKSMFTDPTRIKVSDPGHPDTCNVCRYYEIVGPEKAATIAEECRASKRGCIVCKTELADILVEYLRPIRERREALLNDKAQLEKIIAEGDAKAKEAASATMQEVKKAVGFF